MSDKSFKVKDGLIVPSLSTAGIVKTNSSGVITSSATLSISEGGTGQTTAANALNALLPLQTNNANYFLQTNGVSPQWTLLPPTSYQTSEPTSPVLGQLWIDSDSSATSFDPSIIRRQAFTATAGQTVFTVTNSFTDGFESVYLNGILLARTSDYTTSNSNTITLGSGAAVNDILEVVGITLISPTNTYTQSEINSAILTAVPSQTGNSGKYLTTDGSSTSWGTIDLSGYLSTSTAASTYLTQTNAGSTYLTQSNAASTYLTQSSASSTYLSQSSASSTYLTQSSAASTYATITNENDNTISAIMGVY